MNKVKALLALVCLLFVSSAEAAQDIARFFEENLHHLRVVHAQSANHSGSTFRMIDGYLRDPNLLSGIGSDKALWKVVNYFSSKGRKQHILFQDSGYIQDPVVIDMLVVCLSSSQSRVSMLALRHLLDYVNDENILERKDQIMESLDNLLSRHQNNADIPRLLVRIRPEDLDEWIAKSTGIPVDVRIALGNADIERDVLKKWFQSVTYDERNELIETLAYSGTEACKIALITGLKDNYVNEGVVLRKSIRVDILLALRRYFPDERIFTNDPVALERYGDSRFDYYRGMESFVDDINSFCVGIIGEKVIADSEHPVSFIEGTDFAHQ